MQVLYEQLGSSNAPAWGTKGCPREKKKRNKLLRSWGGGRGQEIETAVSVRRKRGGVRGIYYMLGVGIGEKGGGGEILSRMCGGGVVKTGGVTTVEKKSN